MKRKPKPTRPKLPPGQARALAAIKAYIKKHRWPPSIRDLGEMLDISSPNGVLGHLQALEQKGYIVRGANQESRALYVVE